jgi:hypothetical protein
MPQAYPMQSKSMPKVVRVNAGDGEAVLYKNLGNGQRIPLLWADTVTLASGTTEVVVSSGVDLGDHKVAEGHIYAMPLSAAGAALATYVSKNTSTNVVKLVSTGAPSADCLFDVLIFVGESYDIDEEANNQIYKYNANKYNK